MDELDIDFENWLAELEDDGDITSATDEEVVYMLRHAFAMGKGEFLDGA